MRKSPEQQNAPESGPKRPERHESETALETAGLATDYIFASAEKFREESSRLAIEATMRPRAIRVLDDEVTNEAMSDGEKIRLLAEEIFATSVALRLVARGNASSPIAPGEIFDPEATDPRLEPESEEQETFERKMAFQRRGLGEARQEFTEMMRDNWDLDTGNFMSLIREKYAPKYGFTEKQIKTFETFLDNYRAKREAVKKISAEKLSPAELYEKLIGKKPYGKIDIIPGPITFYFQISDPRDFARVAFHDQMKATKRDEPTEEDVKELTVVGGASISGCEIPELGGTIIAQNGLQPKEEQTRLYIHEEQHAIRKLYADSRTFNLGQGMNGKESRGEKVLILRDALNNHVKNVIENDAQDEILAFLKDGGWTAKNIITFLTTPKDSGGIYDYFARNRRWLEETSRRAGFDQSMMDEAMEYEFKRGRYNELIAEAVHSAITLLKAMNNREKLEGQPEEVAKNEAMRKTLSALISEPIRKWKHIVENL